jgi:hypothetical protein
MMRNPKYDGLCEFETDGDVVGEAGIELEPFSGRLSPLAKS